MVYRLQAFDEAARGWFDVDWTGGTDPAAAVRVLRNCHSAICRATPFVRVVECASVLSEAWAVIWGAQGAIS